MLTIGEIRYSCKRSTLELVRECCVNGDVQRAIEILDILMDDDARKLKRDEQKKSYAAIQMMKRLGWSADDIAIAEEYNRSLAVIVA